MCVLRSVEARFGRWSPVVLSVAALGVVILIGVVLTYAPALQGTPAPNRGPPFVFSNASEIRATGATGGPGGCAVPRGVAVEYCYRLGIQFGTPALGAFNLSGPAAYQFANTSVVVFSIVQIGVTSAVPFVNVTLLAPTGELLAEFDPSAGWNAYAPATLPLVIWANDSAILNFGPTSGAGYDLVASEGAWGSTQAALP